MSFPVKSVVIVAVISSGLTALAAGLSSTSSYVQDGLVTHFDGIDNEKTGTHNPAAAQWKDLVGSATLTPTAKGFWGATCFNCGTNQQQIVNATVVHCGSATVEAAVNLDYIGRGSASSTVWPFLVNSSLSFHGGGDSSRTFRFFVCGDDSRPNAPGITDNTLSGTSDGSSYRVYKDGALQDAVKSHNALYQNGTTWYLCSGNGGVINASFYSFRVYNRALTDAELAQNARIDRLRFRSPRVEGTGGLSDWSAAAWVDGRRQPTGVPAATTNEYAVIVNETLNVASTDNPALALLSIEDGAKLNVAANAAVSVKELYVEGVKIAHGIYTSASADWMTGAGVVRVAGGADRGIPSVIPTPAQDGFYEFGLLDGRVGYAVGFKTYGNSYHYIKGEWPQWDDYAFPPNAKLRLKGYILLETVPADTFVEVDMSQLKYAMLHASKAFADDTPLEIPSGASFRYQPGTWTSYTGLHWLTTSPALHQVESSVCYANVKMNGGTFEVRGDGVSFAYPIFAGNVYGRGTYYSTNFGKQGRFRGGFDFALTSSGFQNGTAMWFDTLTVTAKLESVTLPSCLGNFKCDASWCGSCLMFGKDSVATPADHELYIKTLNANASSNTDGNGKRWRTGGHLFAWGSNTLHVGTLQNGLHVVTRAEEFDHRQGYVSTSRKGVGPCFLVVDRLSNGNLYLSTNAYCTVGTVSTSSIFDYTYQSNAVNRATLDITNACASSAVVKATDLSMLPARLSGFTGKVQLTGTATKTYAMTVDLSKGPDALYTTDGCIGSGTLDAAPANGTVNVTLTGEVPVCGSYALARFTSGGAKLANWQVNVAGHANEPQFTVGSGEDVKVVTVKKDATGLWLKVSTPGLVILLK